MNRDWERASELPRRNPGPTPTPNPPAPARPGALSGPMRESWRREQDPAWADAERAAEELRRELEAIGDYADFVGFRVVRNVVGRPVVQLGTVDPDIARELADLIRLATTRTLYIVQGEPEQVAHGRRLPQHPPAGQG